MIRTKKYSYIQDKLSKDREIHGDTVSAFNRCYHFIEVLVKLRLLEEMTGHSAKELLSWRDIQAYE